MQRNFSVTLDDPSFALLYQRFAPVLFAHLYRHTSSREDAEDLLLEVFLGALEYTNFMSLSTKEQEGWLWSVTRHKMVDHYRRTARRAGLQLDLVIDNLYEREEDAPESITLRHEEYTLLRANIKRLPALQQEVLRLRFANDLHCAEIAKVLHKSEGAIRMLLSRTLKLLRAVYNKEGEEKNDAQ